MNLEQILIQKLGEIKKNNLYRQLRTLSKAQSKNTVIDGKEVLLFSSNSYLGLADNKEIKKKAVDAIRKYGTGSGGSRLTTGNFDLHMELEAKIAAFKRSDAAILFNCGYMANTGIIPALCNDEETVIFSDALNHASIVDGCRLSKAKTVIYAHNDIDDLREKIKEVRPKKGMIVTDGVFSMDGDIAELPKIVQLAKETRLAVMVDDAHATGVIGKTGRGTAEYFGLSHSDIDVMMGTLSKAIPSEGGFVCGSTNLCDYLRNSSRSFIFSTSISPATVASSIAALEYIAGHPERVTRLQNNIAYLNHSLERIGISSKSKTAIIPIIIGDEEKSLAAFYKLFEMGIFVPCIRYPTVKKGEARLRVTLMATHTHSDIDYLTECLKRALC
ncbi:MAG: 8-amino-7-oxononanoate synthase [Desulfuromonadales bacterium]|nr:8-amino-7-oxononanoate synthase [Desulfuromonadales bacterium]